MNLMRRGATTVAIAGSLLAGGALGATVFAAGSSGAATATTQTATNVPSGQAPPAATSNGQVPPAGAPNGTFKSNEEPAHEAKESAQREAEETAGKFPKTSP